MVQALFDLALQMFGAEAYAEGLAFQHKAAVHQHGKGIPGRMAHRKHQRFAGKGAVRGKDASDVPVFLLQAGQCRVEVHLAAQGFDFPADGGDDAPQQVGAHMGLLLPGDLRRGTVLQKHLRDKTAPLVADAGGQLAVREGACAALSKLDVGIGVQLAGDGKMLHRLHARVQRRAAFQHDGPIALPGQQQRGKQARRAKTDDHRAMDQRRFPRCKVEFRRLCITDTGRGPGQCRFLTLVLECDCDGVDKHRRTVPGVHAEFCHTAMRRPAGGHAENGQRLRRCLGVRVGAGQRQPDVADYKHR